LRNEKISASGNSPRNRRARASSATLLPVPGNPQIKTHALAGASIARRC
jgi:hypothetical protein